MRVKGLLLGIVCVPLGVIFFSGSGQNDRVTGPAPDTGAYLRPLSVALSGSVQGIAGTIMSLYCDSGSATSSLAPGGLTPAISYDNDTGSYSLSDVSAGTYTITLTCLMAGNDATGSRASVSVVTGEITTGTNITLASKGGFIVIVTDSGSNPCSSGTATVTPPGTTKSLESGVATFLNLTAGAGYTVSAVCGAETGSSSETVLEARTVAVFITTSP